MGKADDRAKARQQELLKDFLKPPARTRDEGSRCGRCGEWLGGGGRCVNGH